MNRNVLKKGLVLMATAGLLMACKKNDNEGVAGTWKLVAVLADPGDGSGTFQAVSSDKVIEFKKQGTVESNGSLCTMTVTADEASKGTYSLADSTIVVAECNSPFPIRFALEESSLILSYPCFEACRMKFVRK